jgi:hypothetical protein
VLDLPICAGVRYGGPIDADVVVIIESEESLPVNCVPLSVMMEFRTPKRWMMSRRNYTAYSDLIVEIGQVSIHFEDLSTAMSKCM